MAFLSGLPTPARKRRLLMPMQAFIDESGGSGQGPIMIAVGLIGAAEKWASFADRWKEGLNLEPPISALHMHEAAHFEGDFKGWSAKQRDARVRLLAETVNGYGFTAIHALIDVQAHQELIAPPQATGEHALPAGSKGIA
jgi:hypothetical protein